MKNYDKQDPQTLARCALTSLRLARIQQNLFSEALPDLSWSPVDWKSTAKAASKISGHVSTLFPIYEMWEEDFDAAESFSENVPLTVLGWSIEEVMDMAGSHPWHDLEIYLFAFDGFFGECELEEGTEELRSQFDIQQPAPIWKVFLKLEEMILADNEHLQQHKERWRNMARRLRYLTANTEHQFLDRDNEEYGYASQEIPWEKDWIDGLIEQWKEAEPYLDSTWAFVNWVKESPDNLDEAVAVMRMVCNAVAEDEQLAKASLDDVREGAGTGSTYVDYLAIQQLLNEMERQENDETENEETTD